MYYFITICLVPKLIQVINRIIQSNQVTIYWKELIQPDREIFVVIILDTTRIVNKCVIDRKQDITMSCISP